LSIRDWGRACFCSTGEPKPLGACGHRFDYSFDGLPKGYDHKYIYSNIGYNLKPLDIQCAIGIEQLKKLPLFTRKRKDNFKILFDFFEKYQDWFVLPRALPNAETSWFSFPLTVRSNAGFKREDIIRYLESRMIETRMLFTGNILKHPAYSDINYRISGDLKNSDQVLENSFFIGLYPGMTQEAIEYLIKIVKEFMNSRPKA
jgi:CDP-6-deoxy-D-xylo-4-hexulose-3-dehydrase